MTAQTRLFVSNIPENVEDSTLKTAFSCFGEVISVDVKSKSGDKNNKKIFGFVTLSATHKEVENCIKHFSSQNFQGNTLYVTRARESFLERLQRERQEEQIKVAAKNNEVLPEIQPKLKLGDKLNPRKRKGDDKIEKTVIDSSLKSTPLSQKHVEPGSALRKTETFPVQDKKKQDADAKRMESMRKKRQEFKEKKSIIKSSLIGIDNTVNKKVIFFDNEDSHLQPSTEQKSGGAIKIADKTNHNKNLLFDDDDGSGEEDISFNVKGQFEGKKGQKVLDLQSRYKSDKRFVLDERFINDDAESDEDGQADRVDLQQDDEKAKQLNILQDVLGVAIKTRSSYENNNKKSKMGMLRFDPTQPEHAKFFAPSHEKPEQTKKSKKKNKVEQKSEVESETKTQPEPPKVQVSKEKFYKVSETLKETIAQPTTFSLRSLFGTNENDDKKDKTTEQDTGYIPLEISKQPKVRNPFDHGEKNPFMYDSSDSEEENEKQVKDTIQPEKKEVAAVWKESLFFTDSDYRLKEGIAFFNKPIENEGQKERRELKSLMKKRIYNNERKNQMFQKKIGGRKKTMKKSYNKNKNNKR